MGKVYSVVARKLNRFNVENRAHKILDRDKPVAAPKYESTHKDIERSMEVDPDFLAKQRVKDINLDERLKQVYVTSKEGLIDIRRVDPERPLPLDRHAVDDFEYGFKEPEKVALGRCTLRQAIKFISDHQSDSETWTAVKIANEYKLKETNVGNILNHFKTFQIYIPDKQKPENILTQAKGKSIGDGNSKDGT